MNWPCLRTRPAQVRPRRGGSPGTLIAGAITSSVSNEELLVIVPDGPLHLVPFAMLAGSRARYLIEEHPVLLAPSARAWVAAARQLNRHQRLPARAFVAGNPKIDRQRYEDLPTLPFAEREAQAVAAMYGVSPILGADVTREAIRRGFSAEVFHSAATPSSTSCALGVRLGCVDPRVLTLASEIRTLSCNRTRLIVGCVPKRRWPMTRTEGPTDWPALSRRRPECRRQSVGGRRSSVI